MIVVGGADKPVIGYVHQLPQVQHATGTGDNIIDKLLGGLTGLPRLVLDFLAVLVGAGQEHDVIALHPLVAGHGIGGDGAIGVSDVQTVGRIIDGRCNVKFALVRFTHR